jgi:Cytochrome P450
VGWSSYHMHRSEAIYGPDSRVYRPERWESGELIKKARLGAGFVDFNGGPRVCLGSMSIRLNELYYYVKVLLMPYRGFCAHGSKLCDNPHPSGVSKHQAPAWSTKRTSGSGKAKLYNCCVSA